MMGKTFDAHHEDTHKTWFFPYAEQVFMLQIQRDFVVLKTEKVPFKRFHDCCVHFVSVQALRYERHVINLLGLQGSFRFGEPRSRLPSTANRYVIYCNAIVLGYKRYVGSAVGIL